MKQQQRLFFIYVDGECESILIDGINFLELVHFAIEPPPNSPPPPPPPVDPDRVVVICHGFSDEVGPHYPLIRTLQAVALKHQWTAVVPDFRKSYTYGHARGRSERVRLILEEIICLPNRPRTLALVGHSQGGAASSLACTRRLVRAANIRGLMLLGSESPLELDGMNEPPPVPTVIVHADGDPVIGVTSMRQVAERWNAPLHVLDSAVVRGKLDLWGDSIHHDFLSYDLMMNVVKHFRAFLSRCEKD